MFESVLLICFVFIIIFTLDNTIRKNVLLHYRVYTINFEIKKSKKVSDSFAPHCMNTHFNTQNTIRLNLLTRAPPHGTKTIYIFIFKYIYTIFEKIHVWESEWVCRVNVCVDKMNILYMQVKRSKPRNRDNIFETTRDNDAMMIGQNNTPTTTTHGFS